MQLLLLFFFYGLFLTSAKCKMKREWDSKSKQPLPYFRRQVEEIYEDNSIESKTDDPRSKLIAFLIENVKEVFKDTDINLLNDLAESLEPTTGPSRLSHDSLSTSEVKESYTETDYTNEDKFLYENLSIHSLPFLIGVPDRTTIEKINKVTKRDKLPLSRDVLFLGESTMLIDDNTLGLENVTEPMALIKQFPIYPSTTEESVGPESRRSCIHCNNVEIPECAAPRNKLIPSMVCENERDKCYSLHTPFGIVDRGCFSVSQNVTIYVCSCNLCNLKSINEMPVLFDSKKEWIHNIVELSYSRRLKRSVLKELSCLHCEVKSADHTDTQSVDCIEGNVNSIPTQICDEREICGIKAIRSKGYIWRGCIKSPLYNYWITFCDSDLCNYDELVSIYDTD